MSKLAKALRASLSTSALMIVDRVVLNVVPLQAWGVEYAAAWITLRSLLFVLMALEGGMGAALSNKVAELIKDRPHQISRTYALAARRQVIWGAIVAVCYGAGWYVAIDIFSYSPFSSSREAYLVASATGAYFLAYYQCQLVSYLYRGLDRTAEGYRYANLVRACEIVLSCGIPLAGYGPVATAAALALCRTMGLIGLSLLATKALREYRGVTSDGYSESSQIEPVAAFYSPSLALYPLYPAATNFLPLVVLGAHSAPLVVSFSLHRLVSRIFVLGAQVVSRVAWPEAMHRPDSLSAASTGLGKLIQQFAVVIVAALIVMVGLSALADGHSFKDIAIDGKLLALFVVIGFAAAISEVALAVNMAQHQYFLPVAARYLALLLGFGALYAIGVGDVYWVAAWMLTVELIGCISSRAAK